jgi:hypothetical protein
MEKTSDQQLASDLQGILEPQFPGMKIEVAESSRWGRMCVTFQHDGFAGLLPEERFHRLVAVIPEEFRESRLAGFVWLELTTGETIEQFLAMPRSEDVADREGDVLAYLQKMNFFERLSAALGASPAKSCNGGFSQSMALLDAKDCPQGATRDAKLVFIRAGAYCDCQALLVGRKALSDAHAGAA